MIASNSYFLLSLASNSNSLSCFGRVFLLICPIFILSCFSKNTQNILCIFYLIGSSSLYACFLIIQRTWKGLKNLFSSFLFLFILIYLLFSLNFQPRPSLQLFIPLSQAFFATLMQEIGFAANFHQLSQLFSQFVSRIRSQARINILLNKTLAW